MINIDNILNTATETVPWEYKLVDNILTSDVYNAIVEGTSVLRENAIVEDRDPNGLWMFKAKELGVSDEVIDLVMDLNIQLLQHHKEVLSQFSTPMNSNIGYFSIPRFNFIGPNVNGTIHDEGDSKTMAMVIYMVPERTQGTKLYTKEDYSTFVKEVEWKQNRAFVMCSNPGVTWHSFHSDNQPRMTLNFYYEKMEKMSYINNLGEDKMIWFYDEYAKGRVATSL
jgi:hypothetical protein